MSSTWFLLDTAHGLEGGPFLLTDLPGLVMGFQADMTGLDLTLNGANVIKLGHAALPQYDQSDDAKRLVLVADRGDGLPELTSTGIDEFMVTPSIALTYDITVVSVFKTPSGIDIVSEHTASADTVSGYKLLTTASPRSAFNETDISQKQFTLDVTAYHIVVQQCDGTHAGHKVYTEAGEVTYGADISTGDPGLGTVTDKIYMSAREGMGSFMVGAWAAYAVYAPRLSDTNRAALIAGLLRWIP